MQFLLTLDITIEQYIAQEVWKTVTIQYCLLHPDQNCRYRRHGSYPREYPEGVRMARFICCTKGITFSLLPDCLCSRVPGTLEEVEAVVSMIEDAVDIASSDDIALDSISVTGLDPAKEVKEADRSEMNVTLYDATACDPGKVHRRLNWVYQLLVMMITQFPEMFGNCRPTLSSFRSVLGDGPILIQLRILAGEKVHELPLPIGLNPHPSRLHEIASAPP